MSDAVITSEAEARAAGAALGFGDPRNSVAYIRAQVARVRWLNANAAERERRRKARLEADPHRLARLARAALKRRRKGARRRTEAYA